MYCDPLFFMKNKFNIVFKIVYIIIGFKLLFNEDNDSFQIAIYYIWITVGLIGLVKYALNK